MPPRLQFSHVLDLCVRLEHHQIVFRDYQVYIDHLFADFTCLLAFLGQLKLNFLLAGENTAVWIAEPD